MVNVIAWPPVGLTGYMIARADSPSVSRGLLTNARRTTASQARRRAITAVVAGIGTQAAGAGYMAELEEQTDAGRHLLRINARSAIWHLASAEYGFRNRLMTWLDGSTDMVWTSGGADLLWGDGEYPLSGVPGTADGWPILTVSGLPPSRIAVRPHERVTVTDGVTIEGARALRVTSSDGSGVAVIRLSAALTLSGLVSIGETESIVCEVLEWPRAVQPLAQEWALSCGLREVFEAETDGFVEVDPWT
jgi:hypothetical protein